MTVEPGERFDPLADPPGHGHRKIFSAGATLLSGEVLGQDAIKFAWDNVAEVLAWLLGVPLEPMPEKIAAGIFGLLALAAFYRTKET